MLAAPLGRDATVLRRALALLLLVLIAGLPQAHAAPNPVAAVQDPDDLLVVDCLLPARVRKMGRKVTYLAPRKPVKTTGLDCEIRGGEYVSYDRADYRTALRVWQQSAESGDPVAQNYVGEIYERGLGTAPDYKAAATWYRKSAEQGHAAAQVNLGQLYERGLGVPADMETAVSWYRRASGLEGTDVAFVSAPGETTQLASLRAELAESERDRTEMRSEISRLEGELSQSRARLSNDEAAAARERDALAVERAELEARKRELAEQQRDIAERERRLTEERAAVQAFEREANDDTSVRQSELDRREAELGARDDAVSQERARLAARAEELDRRERALGESERTGEANAAASEALAAERHKLGSEREALAASAATLESERAELGAQRAELDRAREAQRRELAEREANLARLEAEFEAAEEAMGDRGEAVTAREQRVAEREAALEAKSAELAALDQEIKRLRDQAEARKVEVAQLAKPASGEGEEIAGPSIQIIEPPLRMTRGIRPVFMATSDVQRVVGRVEAPAGLYSVTLNDKAIEVTAHGIFERELPVGENGTDVRIVAIDELGKRASRNFLVQASGVRTIEPPAVAAAPDRPKLPPINFGNYHALVIGNNAYRSLPTLDTARNDAKVVSGLLRDKYGFKVTTIYDADRYQTLSALNNLRRELTEDDNLLIYYAGHGELDKTNMRGHWLPIDAEADSTANWISNVALTDMLNSMSARHVLVIADSCYSGALTRSSLARLEAGMSEQARVKWIETMAAKRSRTALTSGGLAPVLDAGGGAHSIFARALIEVLESNDVILEAQRVFQEVSARVTYEAPIEQLPQYSPIRFAGHESGDFFFVPAVIPAG